MEMTSINQNQLNDFNQSHILHNEVQLFLLYKYPTESAAFFKSYFMLLYYLESDSEESPASWSSASAEITPLLTSVAC